MWKLKILEETMKKEDYPARKQQEEQEQQRASTTNNNKVMWPISIDSIVVSFYVGDLDHYLFFVGVYGRSIIFALLQFSVFFMFDAGVIKRRSKTRIIVTCECTE